MFSQLVVQPDLPPVKNDLPHSECVVFPLWGQILCLHVKWSTPSLISTLQGTMTACQHCLESFRKGEGKIEPTYLLVQPLSPSTSPCPFCFTLAALVMPLTGFSASHTLLPCPSAHFLDSSSMKIPLAQVPL